jgi:hypothetical protein
MVVDFFFGHRDCQLFNLNHNIKHNNNNNIDSIDNSDGKLSGGVFFFFITYFLFLF